MRTGRNRMKNTLFFGFPSSTEPTGIIDVREIAIDSEYGIQARNYGYTPKGLDCRRDQIATEVAAGVMMEVAAEAAGANT